MYPILRKNVLRLDGATGDHSLKRDIPALLPAGLDILCDGFHVK